MQRATLHFYCHVQTFGDIGDLAMLLTFACWGCDRVDCIAQWCLSFASCKRVGLGLVGLKTVLWAFFAHLSHTTLSQPLFHTQLSHVFLCNTPSFAYNFVTHNSSHTTCFTFQSATTSFVFPSFPVPATSFVAAQYRKSWQTPHSERLTLQTLKPLSSSIYIQHGKGACIIDQTWTFASNLKMPCNFVQNSEIKIRLEQFTQ